jgi:exosortase A
MTEFGRAEKAKPSSAILATIRAAADDATLFRPTLWLILAVGVALLLLVFQQESRAAVQVWFDDTAYGHCFFVPAIAAYLAWERRHEACAAPLKPLPWLAPLAIPGGLVWFAAERLGLMEGQQLAAMTLLQLFFLVTLGWARWRALSAALLYLYFMVPFGAFVTPALQHFTAQFTRIGLDLLGIPNFTDDLLISIPEGQFLIAEACAGLRFLIASVAFGVLYACMIYRSPSKRLLYILASIAIPIVANGFRALGIVTLGHVIGSAEAAAVDHVLYGWIFFSLVILMLIGAGLPFREDGVARSIPAPAPPAPIRPTLRAALLSAALIGLIPVSVETAVAVAEPRMDAARDAALAAGISGCFADGQGARRENGALVWQFSCPVVAGPVERLDLRINLLSGRANPASILRIRWAATDELSADDSSSRPFMRNAAADWTMVETIEPDRDAVYAAWSDGAPVGGGWRQRVAGALGSLSPNRPDIVVATLTIPKEIDHLTPLQRNLVLSFMQGVIAHNPGLPMLLREIAK